jgi:hypothetical protein
MLKGEAMYQCVIIYAPADKALETVVKNVQTGLNKKLFSIRVLPAGKALISHIALADLVILTSLKDGDASIHKDFSALVRTFTGVNLSGKMAGFITGENCTLLKDFKQVLHDTGISFFDEPLLKEEGGRTGSTALVSWIKKIESEFKEFKSVRSI